LDAAEIVRPHRLALGGMPGEEFVLRRVVHVRNAGRDADQINFIAGDPTVEREPAVGAVGGAVGDEVGLAVRRVLQVFAEVHEMRGANLHRLAVQRGFTKQRFGRRAGRLRPRLAEIGGPAEADERAEPGPVVIHAAVRHRAVRVQAIGAVVPNAVVNQAAARIAALVGRGIGVIDALVGHRELERIVTQNRGKPGGGIRAAGGGAEAVDLTIGPRRIQVAVGGP
jgi:hypothetical protein